MTRWQNNKFSIFFMFKLCFPCNNFIKINETFIYAILVIFKLTLHTIIQFIFDSPCKNMNFNNFRSSQLFSEPPLYYRQLFASYCSLQTDFEILLQKNRKLQNKIQQKTNSIAVLQQKVEKNLQKTGELINQEDFFNKYLSPGKQKKQSSQNFEQNDQKQFKEKQQKIVQNNLVFTCEYSQCGKQYNTQISLNLHIKLKHNGGSKKERQAYAKLIMQSQKNGQPAPKIFIELPPNYLKNLKEKQQNKLAKQKQDSKYSQQNGQDFKEKI